MPTRDEKINALVAKRKGDWVLMFREDPSRAAELMDQYGVPDAGASLFQGLQQGAAHGFADDFERMTRGDGVASNHIRAQAANPELYALGTVAGTSAVGLGLRKSGEIAGEASVANAKRASTRMGAGVDRNAAKNAAKVEETRKFWGGFPLPGAKPAVRATVMDAGHGALWGYGGADASKDEEAFDLERLGRAAIGAGVAGTMSPFVVGGIGAAGNLPLTWGGRRIGSKRMYEPPGVTRANPAGLPKRAIDIAKAKDEVAARGMRLPDETGRTENMGKLNRDPVPPLQSVMPRTQKLADQVLAVRAPERIDALKAQQRAMSSRLVRESQPDQPDMLPAPQGAQPDLFAARRSPVSDDELAALAQPITRPEGPDRPVLEDWYARLQSLNAKDPTVMPRMKAILARVAADNEVNNPGANDVGAMPAYLHRMGMAGNKAENRQPVIPAARERAAAAFPTQRLDEALQRTRTADYPVRQRHADAIEAEMQGYQQPAYVDPALAREQSLVARGDDKAAWVNPIDFVADMFTKREKTPAWAVNAAGGMSGPIAYGTESALAANEPRGEWREPDLSQAPPATRPAGLIGGSAPRKPVASAALPVARPAPPQAAQPVIAPPEVRQATPDQVVEPVRVFQRVMEQEGIDIGPEGADARLGPNTRRGIMALQAAMGIEPTGELDARTVKYINMLATGELQRDYPNVYGDFRSRLNG